MNDYTRKLIANQSIKEAINNGNNDAIFGLLNLPYFKIQPNDHIYNIIYNYSIIGDHLNIFKKLLDITGNEPNVFNRFNRYNMSKKLIEIFNYNSLKIIEYIIDNFISNSDWNIHIFDEMIKLAASNKQINLLKLLLSNDNVIKGYNESSNYGLFINIINLQDFELFKMFLNFWYIKGFRHDTITPSVKYILKNDSPEEYIKLYLVNDKILRKEIYDQLNLITAISDGEKQNNYKYINTMQSLLLSDKIVNYDEISNYNENTIALFGKVLDNIIKTNENQILNTYINKYPLLLSIYFIENYPRVDYSNIYDFYIHTMLNKLLKLYEDKLDMIMNPTDIKKIYYTLAILISIIPNPDFQTKVRMLEFFNDADDYSNASILFSRFFNNFAGLPLNTDVKFNMETMLKFAMKNKQ